MTTFELAKFIPWFPAVGVILCLICCTKPALRKLAGPICVLSILTSFIVTCLAYKSVPGVVGTTVDENTKFAVLNLFDWIHVGNFKANFSYFFDPLTIIMLFVVTGIGTLIATYAMGYMHGERGYARFFAAVALFIFSMTNLVMGDNLLVLYLGWEGVGLCSYLLIGYYYDQPIAVEAAKKAFIVNRIGDLGFALGIFLTYLTFGSIEFNVIIPAAQELLANGSHAATALSEPVKAAIAQAQSVNPAYLTWIPFLLMLGAFGKSAQIPLFVWLPDAMAGPTPVSALVHAATMVTSGVYMVARLTPIFQLSEYALPAVALVGGITCIFAGTIALTNNDLKGVFAYSTVSQLGYMFIGVAVISVGGIFHLTTHAFFKALLFLTAGSVMHALAGNLDIRTMSGMRKKMPVTCWLMFFGCLALAGFPFTAGYYSKDLLLGDAILSGIKTSDPIAAKMFYIAGILGIITAFMTAFYTFRLWFKVFMGPYKYEMGTDAGHEPVDDMEVITDAVAKQHEQEHDHTHHHGPHEMPLWPMNLPLVPLALGSIILGALVVSGLGILDSKWFESMLENSTQFAASHIDHSEFAHHTHTTVAIISIILAVLGISLAAIFHWWKREWVAPLCKPITPIINILVNKYYIDELYELLIRRPLHTLGRVLFVFDDYVLANLVNFAGFVPRLVGYAVRPTQNGVLQNYGVGMVIGLAVVIIIAFYAWLGF
ncbi:NADH-quinone oxidoreductase subunit L [Poriferisphaera corsica]|uniref:NADH-quinone oxidoreductase subunit L n=1 Tax=Poriferisphaera corsica TaxID=2528020 RepID=A0A517YV97_9BACT|nr:NADH-quinone oxidoreductase subunit L [Poriferisphaera corsica]QDU34126.1 NADH-quinone oxidoreductase subunit L [Poriferisphaera corsica]